MPYPYIGRIMGAADEAHEDRPDATLVEKFPVKWEHGGVSTSHPQPPGAQSSPALEDGGATTASAAVIIFLWIASNAITSDRKSASNAFKAIESSFVPHTHP